MYLTKEELKSAIYNYQIEQITEADDDIILMAIGAAEDEAKGYLRPNDKKEFKDGRKIYDVATIFTTTGTDRNVLLMEMIKSIAVWYIIRLCNVDMLYDHVKERYDRAIAWLKDVQKGVITLDLPTINLADTNGDGQVDENDDTLYPFRFGSRNKFNHE